MGIINVDDMYFEMENTMKNSWKKTVDNSREIVYINRTGHHVVHVIIRKIKSMIWSLKVTEKIQGVPLHQITSGLYRMKEKAIDDANDYMRSNPNG